MKKHSRRKPRHRRKTIKKKTASLSNKGDPFRLSCFQLAKIFLSYNPHDVLISLSSSDLWLPNIGSQVKHILAFSVFVSLNPLQFATDNRIENYSSLIEFLGKVHSALPDFAMLEDYVPETDWGEIKIPFDNDVFSIFYGGSLERIPDYIDAFRLAHSAAPAPLRDVQLSIRLQDFIISKIDRSIVGDPSKAAPGHIELPSEQFWRDCRAALLAAAEEPSWAEISADLIARLGSLTHPATHSQFADMIMAGRLPPAIMIEIDLRRYPLSLRSAVAVVIDYWSAPGRPNAADADVTTSLGTFLRRRFGGEKMFAEPFFLSSSKRELHYRFAALIHEGEDCHLIVTIPESEVDSLNSLDTDLHDFFAQKVEWGLRPEHQHRIAQLRDQNNRILQPATINVIVVIVTSGTALRWVPRPKIVAKFLLLPDFVTIFDSLTDFAELWRFWSYLDSISTLAGPSLTGLADLFATFRDSHATPVEGAITPTMIFFDPHWGSNWRFKELASYWSNAPTRLPDSSCWLAESLTEGVKRLISKASLTLACSTTIGTSIVQFVFDASNQELDSLNGRLLELLVQCLSESLYLRRSALQGLQIFERRQIVTDCRADSDNLASETLAAENLSGPLFTQWRLLSQDNSTLRLSLSINLAYTQARLVDAVDASFESQCVREWIQGVAAFLGDTVPIHTLDLAKMDDGSPRYSLTVLPRTIDAPEMARAKLPEPTQYKIARRELAKVFQSLGTEPGRYELAAAKATIDPARDEFRKHIHDAIGSLELHSLLTYCIQQHDALILEYIRTMHRIQHSLTHQVSFDRSDAAAEALDSFTTNARNYRYLIEACLSMPNDGKEHATHDRVIELIAEIDWLLVLHNASDVLHNDIEVAGVELDSNFVPNIFYSADRDQIEQKFGREAAGNMLGVDLDAADAVCSPKSNATQQGLDNAFLADAGFSFTHLIHTLTALSRWQAIRGETELHLNYQASKNEIVAALSATSSELDQEGAHRLVDFLTLNPKGIRRLIGKPADEGDVPVWEHNKRADRYTIKPLVPKDEGILIWGAAAAERALGIWTRSISNGYLPADFPWAHVQTAVRAIKAGLEKQLEVQAADICSRFATFVVDGLDFRRRFPKLKFDDVGDFDVLAYWPESNSWLIVECKYNQPPFCIKDARRLRERIFGVAPDRGQFSKIDRRRQFLTLNSDRMRDALGWPASHVSEMSTYEAYASRDIYWWMRNPPYPVSAEFVRIDGLDGWLQSKGFAKK